MVKGLHRIAWFEFEFQKKLRGSWRLELPHRPSVSPRCLPCGSSEIRTTQFRWWCCRVWCHVVRLFFNSSHTHTQHDHSASYYIDICTKKEHTHCVHTWFDRWDVLSQSCLCAEDLMPSAWGGLKGFAESMWIRLVCHRISHLEKKKTAWKYTKLISLKLLRTILTLSSCSRFTLWFKSFVDNSGSRSWTLVCLKMLEIHPTSLFICVSVSPWIVPSPIGRGGPHSPLALHAQQRDHRRCRCSKQA